MLRGNRKMLHNNYQVLAQHQRCCHQSSVLHLNKQEIGLICHCLLKKSTVILKSQHSQMITRTAAGNVITRHSIIRLRQKCTIICTTKIISSTTLWLQWSKFFCTVVVSSFVSLIIIVVGRWRTELTRHSSTACKKSSILIFELKSIIEVLSLIVKINIT